MNDEINKNNIDELLYTISWLRNQNSDLNKYCEILKKEIRKLKRELAKCRPVDLRVKPTRRYHGL